GPPAPTPPEPCRPAIPTTLRWIRRRQTASNFTASHTRLWWEQSAPSSTTSHTRLRWEQSATSFGAARATLVGTANTSSTAPNQTGDSGKPQPSDRSNFEFWLFNSRITEFDRQALRGF